MYKTKSGIKTTAKSNIQMKRLRCRYAMLKNDTPKPKRLITDTQPTNNTDMTLTKAAYHWISEKPRGERYLNNDMFFFFFIYLFLYKSFASCSFTRFQILAISNSTKLAISIMPTI